MRSIYFVLAVLFSMGCAVSEDARREEAPAEVDELVRDRTLKRIDELANSARDKANLLRDRAKAKDCTDACELSDSICDLANRSCDLAADYPTDEVFKERCMWPTSDCQEAKVICANCGGSQPASDGY